MKCIQRSIMTFVTALFKEKRIEFKIENNRRLENYMGDEGPIKALKYFVKEMYKCNDETSEILAKRFVNYHLNIYQDLNRMKNHDFIDRTWKSCNIYN